MNSSIHQQLLIVDRLGLCFCLLFCCNRPLRLSHFLPPGILREDGTLDNAASCNRLGEVALAYARAGESLVLFFVLVLVFLKSVVHKQLPLFDPYFATSPCLPLCPIDWLCPSFHRVPYYCPLRHDGWENSSHQTSTHIQWPWQQGIAQTGIVILSACLYLYLLSALVGIRQSLSNLHKFSPVLT